jgi:hypothetical protein
MGAIRLAGYVDDRYERLFGREAELSAKGARADFCITLNASALCLVFVHPAAAINPLGMLSTSGCLAVRF